MRRRLVTAAGAAQLVLALACLQLASGRPEPRTSQPAPGDSSNGARRQSAAAAASLFEPHDSNEPTCGYASCPKLDATKLNVHVVAHTHDDVGWLKTVDQYFYGTNKRYSKVGVENILDSLIPVLAMDKSKRFVYVEMSFFSKWWREQDERVRLITRELVDEGRLEFINGGWCMNDEATVTYHSTIEQMTLGLKFLNDTFGACGRPRVGWQIDPFGHSNEQASLFAQFGFDGMYFSRIGYKDKLRRTNTSSLDLIWHGDRALPGQTGSIFTNVFRDHYELGLYCFDTFCQDDAVVDNKDSFEYNADRLGQRLIKYAREYAASKLTNNILIPFGGDFHFTAASQNFKSFDRLIKYVNGAARDINIFYSTPSCYQWAVHQFIEAASGGQPEAADEGAPQAAAKRVNLPEKYHDFMPYDSSPSVWWSGYFASRPSVKLIERETAQLLQVARMISLANLLNRPPPPASSGAAPARQAAREADWLKALGQQEAECLVPLWEVLGDLQHHDAVTGTEKQHVTDDYQRRAADASRRCARMISPMKRQLIEARLRKSPRFERLKQAAELVELDPIFLEDTMFCRSLNISECEALESDVDVRNYGHLKVVKAQLQQQLQQQQQQPKSGLSRSVPHRPLPMPKELETRSILLTVYNPLARPLSNVDIRLPCNGKCDVDRVQVIHLASNETQKLVRLPLPAGVARLPFRQARTTYEILFYASVPALGSTSYLIGDENSEDLVDEELSDDAVVITDESSSSSKQNVARARRIQRSNGASESRHDGDRFEYFEMSLNPDGRTRSRRGANDSTNNGAAAASDRVVLKFDMRAGVITGLRRVSDGSVLNITQKFGRYFAAEFGHPPGAYIFRPNSSEPYFFDKPLSFKMYKRQNGGLIEVHQKWADWIWQTIRVDARKNYIEFDYVIGPVPVSNMYSGTDVITRYITSMDNDNIFLTDSNARQLLPRLNTRNWERPADLGGSFYPVGSTLIIRNNKLSRSNLSAEAVAVLVDRAQAGTSLNTGDLELMIHRRHMRDDAFGVDEALNEPGEDGRGLVTRGRHRLFLKFQDSGATSSSPPTAASFELPADANNRKLERAPKSRVSKQFMLELSKTPRQNLTYEQLYSCAAEDSASTPAPLQEDTTYLVYDQLYNDIRQESVMFALRPLLTFDRLRVTASEFLQLMHNSNSNNNNNNAPKTDQTLLNATLPNNVHLLTLQVWNGAPNRLLLRFENLDNPLTIHAAPDKTMYDSLLRSYELVSSVFGQVDSEDKCRTRSVRPVEIDIEYLLRNIKITSVSELALGANARLSEVERLDWTNEQTEDCSVKPTSTPKIKLGPRQIKTLLATFEHL